MGVTACPLYWCFDMFQSWAIIRVYIFSKVSEISILYSNLLNIDMFYILYVKTF